MKTYRGSRDDTGTSLSVTVRDGEETMHHLPLRLDLKNHSPLGFWWGQSGSGAAQLSLALLADHLGNDVQALRHYVPFMGFLLKLQDGEGNPVAAWSLTSADIDAALDELLRSSSPTWPYVGAFANEMERDARTFPVDAPEFMGVAGMLTSCFESVQAISRMVAEWNEDVSRLPVEKRPEARRLTARIGTLAHLLAFRLDALPKPVKGQRLMSEDKAAQRQLHLLGELEKVRVLLGANPGESVEDALYRYTAAVQLGCAKSLDVYAQAIRGGASIAPPSAEVGVLVAAAALRGNVELHFDTAAVQQPDVFRRFLEDRWAEFQQGVVDGILPRFCAEVLGELTSPSAKEALRSLLESYEPIGALRLNVVPEYEPGTTEPDGDDPLPASGVTDEGRAAGCLDPMCGDCDMK
jgi:hypothetical protein